ncbi:zinc finger protein [Corchorus olitorius]|uniref:Zinc finger protein n=1 Tax=Corchorus olitorius TaxID=93759 RepID=A0A1R3K6M5_9ROSI|nr:zinc finger protein [Corchorus olitorius]
MPDFNRSSNGAQNPETSSSFSPSYQICPYFPKLKPLKSRPKNDPTPFLHRRSRDTTVQWPQISTMLFTASFSFECLHLIFDRSSYSSGILPYPRVAAGITSLQYIFTSLILLFLVPILSTEEPSSSKLLNSHL